MDMRIKRINILGALVCGLLATGLAACSDSPVETLSDGTLDDKSHIVLTFVTPNDNASTRSDGTGTRSADGDPDGYEAGIGYEDYINISGSDYKIYFFTYDSGDEKGGTLIAEFKPTDVKEVDGNSYTTYTVTGDVPNELLSVTDFSVVMLANYGLWYPSVTVGSTTIDDLCEGTNTTFNAFNKFVIEADNLIPFYGVQEYSSVSFTTGETTSLKTPVSLLRAVAKVEVIVTSDSDVNTFDAVEIVNYNSTGYCAPTGVYTADDYNADYGIQPEDDEWPNVFVNGLHIVGGANDTDSKTQAFTQITDANQDTWRIYLPEYDNSGDDYCYITVTIDGEEYNIYFAEYTDGTTDNTDTSKRLNLKRNNLYRFYVTVTTEEAVIRVVVNDWKYLFDNTYTFGETE